ncbi:MAG: ATP-binding protein, partial [Anaerotardibacter sp.]
MTKDSLRHFIEEVTDGSHLRVQDDLGDGFVRLKAAEAQRRQAKQDIRSFEDVIIEMLRNARDAHASVIFVATWKEGTTRYLSMIDNGD